MPYIFGRNNSLFVDAGLMAWLALRTVINRAASGQIEYNNNNNNNVAYMLKSRTVELEKQPLLANGSETTFVSRQRLGKHVPAVTDKHVTIEVLLETVFCARSVKSGYKKDNWGTVWRRGQYLHRSPACRRWRRKGKSQI
jgi:hypothetical protein